MGSCICVNNSINITNLEAEVVGDTHNNNEISKYMKKKKEISTSSLKILLLGIGSSGKSTLFKQIECIHGNGFQDDEIQIFIKHIRWNMIVSIKKLLKQSSILNNNNCLINLNNESNISAIKLIKEYDFDSDYFEKDVCSAASAIKLLWNLDGIQNTYKLRYRFSLLENMNYFFNKIDIIFSNNYIPSSEDILKSKSRTCGIVSKNYIINSTLFHIFDVGGQRNERKKWIQMFDGVNGLIFVAALSDYASVLFENENTNSMKESLKVFHEICNLKWFNDTQIILFLNKNDIFREQLKIVKLNQCFGDKYNGPNYQDNHDDNNQNDDEWFNYCHSESLKFIKNQYLILLNKLNTKNNQNNKNKLFTHITDATSQNNIQKVFSDITKFLITRGFGSAGF